jgi:hypothetical protein
MSNQEEARSSLKRRQRGHVMPLAPIISLSDIGRLRTAHVLALCGISHSVLYTRQKIGTFPKSDGKDGPHNFWNTKTIREFLGKPAESNSRDYLYGTKPVRLLKSSAVTKSSQQV